MILLKNGHLHSPEDEGVKDIFIGGTKIISVGSEIDVSGDINIEIVDCSDYIIVPGLIDNHVHITGGGGEGGPETRTLEPSFESYLKAGITSVIGCLGTDSYTRTLENVLMMVKKLRRKGLSAWMYTGAYRVPSPSLLGDIGKDITLIDEVIGFGEIAVADHRSSYPSVDEFIRLASQARIGGMLGGKAGIVNVHLGDGSNPFELLYKAVENSELTYTQFLPTHINRNKHILKDAEKYGKLGFVDITTSIIPITSNSKEVKPSKAFIQLLKAGVPAENITFSSDGGGSIPIFKENGEFERLDTGSSSSILKEIKDLVLEEKIPLDVALQPVTSTAARILKLQGKGFLRAGMDGDVLVLDKNLDIVHLIANGEWLIKEHKLQ